MCVPQLRTVRLSSNLATLRVGYQSPGLIHVRGMKCTMHERVRSTQSGTSAKQQSLHERTSQTATEPRHRTLTCYNTEQNTTHRQNSNIQYYTNHQQQSVIHQVEPCPVSAPTPTTLGSNKLEHQAWRGQPRYSDNCK